MESVPPPPHERDWRHPSEVAAAERAAAATAAPTRTARYLVAATGMFGLVIIGLFAVTVSPTALSTQAPPTTTAAISTQRFSGAVGIASQHAPNLPGAAPVIPLDDGLHAVGILDEVVAAVGDETGIIVELPDGTTARGRIVVTGDDAAVVRLSREAAGYSVTERRPSATEVVTVMDAPPVTIAYSAVDRLDVPNGTPVLDQQGQLIGLCDSDDEETLMVRVSDEYERATLAGR